MKGLAAKHCVTKEYVCHIFRGRRPANSAKAKAIAADMEKVLEEIQQENINNQ